MHKLDRTLRLGALRPPGEPRDRFALAEVLGRRDGRTGALLADGVEWGVRR